jgi:acyl-CoA dehydrogenase
MEDRASTVSDRWAQSSTRSSYSMPADCMESRIPVTANLRYLAETAMVGSLPSVQGEDAIRFYDASGGDQHGEGRTYDIDEIALDVLKWPQSFPHSNDQNQQAVLTLGKQVQDHVSNWVRHRRHGLSVSQIGRTYCFSINRWEFSEVRLAEIYDQVDEGTSIKTNINAFGDTRGLDDGGAHGVFPRRFADASTSDRMDPYLRYSVIQKLIEFFQVKGLEGIKDEDRRETWYDDWLQYQASHRLYATVLSPAHLSSVDGGLDLLRLARFVEAFAYFSPAHGYSMQVTFLGLFAILAGSNDALKKQAVAALEAGGLLAFGVSEKNHGSDLFNNEFTVSSLDGKHYLANGSKYYIGNAHIAGMIAVLARKQDARARRAPFVLFALRPNGAGVTQVKKIHTSGVRAAYVGVVSVKDYRFDAEDVIAEGRAAWDAAFASITMGKFFLGFGSIGICEHAMAEAVDHLTTRILYGHRVIDLPHIRGLMVHAAARLTAMKLYAYRALDYVHAANEADRRYELFNAVQKAKVGTEGVKVMSLIGECVGAKGFEADTYIEMARRDAQLIPAVEGSTHVNLALAAQFAPRYLARRGVNIAAPHSLVAGEIDSAENAYLLQPASRATRSICFGYFLDAYRPLMALANARILCRQAKGFSCLLRGREKELLAPGSATALSLAQLLVTFAYAQLIAENCVRCRLSPQMASAVFHGVVEDASTLALSLAASPHFDPPAKRALERLIVVPKTSDADWSSVTSNLLREHPTSP